MLLIANKKLFKFMNLYLQKKFLLIFHSKCLSSKPGEIGGPEFCSRKFLDSTHLSPMYWLEIIPSLRGMKYFVIYFEDFRPHLKKIENFPFAFKMVTYRNFQFFISGQPKWISLSVSTNFSYPRRHSKKRRKENKTIIAKKKNGKEITRLRRLHRRVRVDARLGITK